MELWIQETPIKQSLYRDWRKQPAVILLRQDLLHLEVCPSRRNGREGDAPFLQGEGATGGWPLPFGSLQLIIRVGGRSFIRIRGRSSTPKRRIIRPVPGRSPPPQWRHCTGPDQSGEGEMQVMLMLACGKYRFNDLDLGPSSGLAVHSASRPKLSLRVFLCRPDAFSSRTRPWAVTLSGRGEHYMWRGRPKS